MTAFLTHLLVFVPANMATNGLATMWLWRWFAVPLGAPAIGFWHAIGIAILASMLTMRAVSSDFDDHPLSTIAYRHAITLAAKWMAIGIAAVVASLMP